MIRKIKNIIREIKYAYQRVVRGYDERIKWEFDSYFSQFIPPLKEFCEEELKEMNCSKENDKRREIYKNTLNLIRDYKNMSDENYYKQDNEVDKLWEYVGKNLRWYWN